MSLPLQAGLGGKTSVSMVVFSSGNMENRSNTNNYLLKLKTIGLDGDPYSFPKNQ